MAELVLDNVLLWPLTSFLPIRLEDLGCYTFVVTGRIFHTFLPLFSGLAASWVDPPHSTMISVTLKEGTCSIIIMDLHIHLF